MADKMDEIQGWLNRGNLRQFYTEVEARLSDTDYTVEQDDGTVRFYRVSKEGGFLGIGAKETRQLVLEAESEEGTSHVVEESANPEFVQFLAKLLEQH